MKQRPYQRSDLQSGQCFIYSPSQNKYFLFKNKTVFVQQTLGDIWERDSNIIDQKIPLSLWGWMNCVGAAVIMQLLSPQDWLDGIQAALLVITIFPMFAALFVKHTPPPTFLKNLHFARTLSKFNGAVSVWQFKACEDRRVGVALYICPPWEIISDVSHKISRKKELKYGKIWSMSPNSDLRHLKAHFFTASFVWRFRFVIFIALHLQSTNAFKQSKKETLYVVFGRRCTVLLWGQILGLFLGLTGVFCPDDPLSPRF